MRAPPPRVAAAGAHLLVAAVATFPLVLSPFSRLVGHEDVDVWNHAWGPWWFWRCLTEGRLPWRTELLNAPAGGVLWYIDPLGAIAGMPLVPILGVVAAYNAVVFAEVALASVAGRRLARALGATDAASWIAAVAVACSPYLLSEVHNGVSEAVGVPWSVFALAAGRRALDEGGWRRWIETGAWLGVTAVGTWYYAFGTALTLLAWTLLARRRDALVGLGLAGLVTAAFAAPVALALRASVTAPDGIVARGEVGAADREMLLSHNAVDPRAFVAPGGFQSVDLAALGEAFVHSSYVGLVALGLALAARRPAVLLGALPTAVLALGPWLWWGGAWVEPSPKVRLALPFQALLLVLPDAAATHAQRVGWPVLAVVAGLAAVGASRLPVRALALLIPAVVADALFAAPWPLARAPALDTSLYAELPRRGAGIVLDLPGEVGATMASSRYLVYQTASGLPIPYRPDARSGTSALLGVKAFAVLILPSLHRAGLADHIVRLVREAGMVDLDVLVQTGVRWIVVHRELERGAQGTVAIERQLEAWYGAPEVRGTHALWDTTATHARSGRVLQAEAPRP